MPKFSKGIANQYKIIAIYGQTGVGKSTLANNSDNPCTIDVERGTGSLPISRITEINTWSEFINTTKAFLTKQELQEFKTVIIDTLDYVEILIHKEIADENNKSHISEIGYAKGYETALKLWEELFAVINQIKDSGKNVILICHEQIKKIESPIYGTYDKVSLRLSNKVIPYIHSMVDGLFYLSNDLFFSAESKEIKKPKIKKSKIIKHFIKQ